MNYRYLVLALLWLGNYSFAMEDESIVESSEISTRVRPTKDFLALRAKRLKSKQREMEYKQELRIKLAFLKQDLKRRDIDHKAALEKDNIDYRAELERSNLDHEHALADELLREKDRLARKRFRIEMKTRATLQARFMQATATAAAVREAASAAARDSMYL